MGRGPRSQDGSRELVDVVERVVHAGEPDVGDSVDRAELVHDHVADHSSRHFWVSDASNALDHAADDPFDVLGADGSLLTRRAKCASNLLRVEGLPALAALEDEGQRALDCLIGRKPMAAVEALPPPPDGVSLPALPAVDDLIVVLVASGTAHGQWGVARLGAWGLGPLDL